MNNLEKAKTALAKQESKQVAVQSNFDKLKKMLDNETVKQRFAEALGKSAGAFTASIVSVASNNHYLKNADPNSIISASLISATLNLPINPNLGFAYIIPYGGVAQFQMGSKGYIQLAIRTGYYKTINVCTVYEGDIKYYNKFTGEMEFNPDNDKQDKPVGFLAYFKLITGFEKYLYMDIKSMEAHAKRFSKQFNSGVWKTDFEAMAHKTIIKRLLSKYGILSIELQKAIEFDQAEIRETEAGELEANYLDNPEVEFKDIPKSEPKDAPEEPETLI